MVALFWLITLCVLYSYFLYPMLLRLFGTRLAVQASFGKAPQSASLLIAARNEEGRIGAKLENALSCDPLPDEFEVIVVSDASTDKTDEIVRDYSDRHVRLVRAEPRGGKEHAQSHGIAASTGEVLIFTDSATRLDTDAVDRILSYFADPRIGAVSSEDSFIGDGGEGAYVRYEMALRGLESRAFGLVGLSGSLFAVRRCVASAWRDDVPSDINAALITARLGLKAVSAPDVRGYYQDIADPSREYQRKYRTVLRGMAAIAGSPDCLNPFLTGGFAFQLWSHKVMRWLTPWFLAALMIVNLYLVNEGTIYRLALLAQFLAYTLALIGWLLPRFRDHPYFRVPYYLVRVHLAMAHAGIDFLRGRRIVTWTPSAR